MNRPSMWHRLTPTFVSNCFKPGIYMDGGGLRFRVLANGHRTWIMRIAIYGIARDMTLGSITEVTLAQARVPRDKAIDIRRAVAEGRDPVEERRAARRRPGLAGVVVDERPTFETCWRIFWQVKERLLSNAKHRDQWEATLKTYVLPHIGKRPIADIRPGEIIDVMKPIWTTKGETARRVLQRIDAIFVSAITREFRDKASPCTGVARELGQRRHGKCHYAALPYGEVAGFVQLLRQRPAMLSTQLAFEFLILTASRSGEARGARWTEMDLDKRLWTLPASRTGNVAADAYYEGCVQLTRSSICNRGHQPARRREPVAGAGDHTAPTEIAVQVFGCNVTESDHPAFQV